METSRLVINGRGYPFYARALIMRIGYIPGKRSNDARELRHVCGARES